MLCNQFAYYFFIGWFPPSGLLSLPLSFQTPALYTIGNVVTGSSHQTQFVLDCGILKHFTRLLRHHDSNIQKVHEMGTGKLCIYLNVSMYKNTRGTQLNIFPNTFVVQVLWWMFYLANVSICDHNLWDQKSLWRKKLLLQNAKLASNKWQEVCGTIHVSLQKSKICHA